jgi:transcriptional regulator with XRE-family HTH domain
MQKPAHKVVWEGIPVDLVMESTIMEAVRGYLKELRLGRHVSQDELADAMGLSRRALIDWETGKTEDLKGGPLLRAIEYLRGEITDLKILAEESFEKGVALARERLTEPVLEFTEEQNKRLDEAAKGIPEDQFDEIIALIEDLKRKNKTGEWLNFGRFLRG